MTIEEAAKQLGVSKSTVSRALSGKGRIGEETRQRIQRFMEEHTETQKESQKEKALTGNIGIVIPADAYTNSIPFFQDCLLGICEAASMLHYDVLVATGVVNDVSSIRTLVEKQKVDGIILTRSVKEDKVLKYLTEQGIPTGLCGSCEYKGVIQVDADNGQAAENLTSILIERGYRRFALVVGDMDIKVNQSRYQGFCNALEKKRLDIKNQVMYTNFTNMSMIDNTIRGIISEKVECIVCGDDVICTRIMSGLQAEGYRIPRDISIVSLYNSSNLDCFSPAVTAVNISARDLGNMISKQMIYCIRGDEYNLKTTLDYEILFRKSAGMHFQI